MHIKLLQYLSSRSAPTVSDPVCRLMEHMFKQSPDLKFVIDNNALNRHSSFNKRRSQRNLKRSSIRLTGRPSTSGVSSFGMGPMTGNLVANEAEAAADSKIEKTPFYKKIKFLNANAS